MPPRPCGPQLHHCQTAIAATKARINPTDLRCFLSSEVVQQCFGDEGDIHGELTDQAGRDNYQVTPLETPYRPAKKTSVAPMAA